jgi:hypothetical protein
MFRIPDGIFEDCKIRIIMPKVSFGTYLLRRFITTKNYPANDGVLVSFFTFYPLSDFNTGHKMGFVPQPVAFTQG